MNLRYVLPLVLGAVVPLSVFAGGGGGKQINLLMSFGQDVVLATNGDVEMHAHCILNEGGGGFDVIRIYAKTTGAHTVLDGFDDHQGNGDYLTPATLETDSELKRGSSTTTLENALNDTHIDRVLSLDTGDGLGMDDTLFVLNPSGMFATLTDPPADCLVSGQIVTFGRFREAKIKK